jgi:hypothetical protein
VCFPPPVAHCRAVLPPLPQHLDARMHTTAKRPLRLPCVRTRHLGILSCYVLAIIRRRSHVSPSPLSCNLLQLKNCDSFVRVATQNVRQGAILGLAGGGETPLPILFIKPVSFLLLSLCYCPTAFVRSKRAESSPSFSAVWATSAGFTIAADEITQARRIPFYALNSLFVICAPRFFVPASFIFPDLRRRRQPCFHHGQELADCRCSDCNENI